MLLEGLFEFKVANLVAVGIEIKQTVETNALHRGHEAARRCEWLKTAAGADAYTCQCAVLIKFGASGIVDVGQCVELVHHDVDVVTADAVALAGDALTFVGTRDSMELTALHLALDTVEVVGDGVHTGGVAYEHHAVGQLFWTQMQMEA